MSDAPTGEPFDVGEAFLSAPEVAARLHVTAQTVRNWIDQGTLPAIRVGRAFRVNPRDVDDLLARTNAAGVGRRSRRGVWESARARIYRESDSV
jgi:excisionase family DNA binding protein